MIDAEKATEGVVAWLQEQFRTSGGKYAVIGISGGKDSTVVAALCAKALGKENVIGVMMPNGLPMENESVAREVCKEYCGKSVFVDVSDAIHEIYGYVECPLEISDIAKTNFPARIRMSTLYLVAQCVEHGRVINTSNLSERYVGYSTRYGDSVGDFSPLGNFTATEVLEIGKYLGVPQKYLDIPPSDGLSGLTDEENLGFTYSSLDGYIRRDGAEIPDEIRKEIDRLHELNEFKQKMMPIYEPSEEIFN